MKPLPQDKFNEIKEELIGKGILEVIDAQNIKGYLREKRKKSNADGDQNKEGIDSIEDHDEILSMLSLSNGATSELQDMLSDKKLEQKNVNISDIDWKNVRVF